MWASREFSKRSLELNGAKAKRANNEYLTGFGSDVLDIIKIIIILIIISLVRTKYIDIFRAFI